MTQTLSELAARYGLDESYYDYRGRLKVFSDAARSAILKAMGADAQSGDIPAAAGWVCAHDELQIQLPDVSVDQVTLHITLELGDVVTQLAPVMRAENGHCHTLLPTTLPLGYHQLQIQAADTTLQGPLVITPARCYEPQAMQHGARYWGLSIQLYTLRSDHNFGIGDFADLHVLIRESASLGCATIGLNPLHALRPADPAHISPYSPSHREFLNVWYIAPSLVDEYCSAAAQQFVMQHQAELQSLRATRCVDYPGMAKLKLALLRILFAELQQQPVRLRAFKSFVDLQGQALQHHALYDALDAHFSSQANRHWGWRSWPPEFHELSSPAVKRFSDTHAKDVEFYLYLQWLAATQLTQTQQLARDCEMTIGLYGDVAVGVDSNGSEVWCNRDLYLESVGVGAPPDPLALKGQDWGIPPQHPLKLAEQAYQPFIRMIRGNMHAAGALRIDHVMTLCRLWWVPRGFDATEGVYVHYPLDDLIKLVALESVRNRCLVIGEDLGTVPDAMREAMHRFGLYHYKVLLFEKSRDGEFIAPNDYVPNALAVVTTHDLPPFKSWWRGDDIELRQQLHLYPDEATQQQVRQERETDRQLLMQALASAGLWHWQPSEPVPPYSFALMRAAYLYAGLSQSRLLVIQPEDLQGMIDPVNVPGTSTQHANWQRKLDEDLSVTLQRSDVIEMLQAVIRARRGEFPNQN